MNRRDYRASGTEERINYLNSQMVVGKKLWRICEEIGIANNVTTEFKKKGYIRNEEGLFIKRDQQHPDQITLDHVSAAAEPQLSCPTVGQQKLTEDEPLVEENVHSNAIEEFPESILDELDEISVDTDPNFVQNSTQGNIPPTTELEPIVEDSVTLMSQIEEEILPNDQISQTTMAQEVTESKEVTIMPTNETKPVDEGIQAVVAPPTVGETEPKKVGRPARSSQQPIKKLTVEIDQEVYKALMHYKVDSGLYVNAYIEDLLKANLPGKYFESNFSQSFDRSKLSREN